MMVGLKVLAMVCAIAATIPTLGYAQGQQNISVVDPTLKKSQFELAKRQMDDEGNRYYVIVEECPCAGAPEGDVPPISSPSGSLNIPDDDWGQQLGLLAAVILIPLISIPLLILLYRAIYRIIKNTRVQEETQPMYSVEDTVPEFEVAPSRRNAASAAASLGRKMAPSKESQAADEDWDSPRRQAALLHIPHEPSRLRALYDFFADREQFRVFLYTSAFGRYWMYAQILATIFACAMLVVEFYLTDEDPSAYPWWMLLLEILYTAFFAVDYAMYMYAAPDRLQYYFNPFSLVDLLTIIPVFAFLFMGSGSTAGQFLRALRAVRALRIVRAYRVISLATAGVHRQIAIISFTMGSMIFIETVVILLLEKSFSPYPAVHNFHNALYWIIVTLSTVGFGDIQPSTDTNRMAMALMIGIGWLVVSINLAKLIALVGQQTRYDGNIKFGRHKAHVLVTGAVTFHAVLDLLREFFHPDRQWAKTNIRVVILFPEDPSPPLLRLMSHPFYEDKVQYLHGTPLYEIDLGRAGAEYALACFVLTNKFSTTPDNTDAQSILAALACVEYHVDLRWKTYVQIITRGAKQHLLQAGVPNVLCLDELQLSLMGQSVIAPGICTLITNMIRTYTLMPLTPGEKKDQKTASADSDTEPHFSVDESDSDSDSDSDTDSDSDSGSGSGSDDDDDGDSDDGGDEKTKRKTKKTKQKQGKNDSDSSKQKKKKKSKNDDGEKEDKATRKLRKETERVNRLRAAAISQHISNQRKGSGAWRQEYYAGCCNEIYSNYLFAFRGKSVADTVCSIYRQSGATLFAMEITDNNLRKIVICVDDVLKRRVDVGDVGFFMALNEEVVEFLSQAKIPTSFLRQESLMSEGMLPVFADMELALNRIGAAADVPDPAISPRNGSEDTGSLTTEEEKRRKRSEEVKQKLQHEFNNSLRSDPLESDEEILGKSPRFARGGSSLTRGVLSEEFATSDEEVIEVRRTKAKKKAKAAQPTKAKRKKRKRAAKKHEDESDDDTDDTDDEENDGDDDDESDNGDSSGDSTTRTGSDSEGSRYSESSYESSSGEDGDDERDDDGNDGDDDDDDDAGDDTGTSKKASDDNTDTGSKSKGGGIGLGRFKMSLLTKSSDKEKLPSPHSKDHPLSPRGLYRALKPTPVDPNALLATRPGPMAAMHAQRLHQQKMDAARRQLESAKRDPRDLAFSWQEHRRGSYEKLKRPARDDGARSEGEVSDESRVGVTGSDTEVEMRRAGVELVDKSVRPPLVAKSKRKKKKSQAKPSKAALKGTTGPSGMSGDEGVAGKKKQRSKSKSKANANAKKKKRKKALAASDEENEDGAASGDDHDNAVKDATSAERPVVTTRFSDIKRRSIAVGEGNGDTEDTDSEPPVSASSLATLQDLNAARESANHENLIKAPIPQRSSLSVPNAHATQAILSGTGRSPRSPRQKTPRGPSRVSAIVQLGSESSRPVSLEALQSLRQSSGGVSPDIPEALRFSHTKDSVDLMNPGVDHDISTTTVQEQAAIVNAAMKPRGGRVHAESDLGTTAPGFVVEGTGGKPRSTSVRFHPKAIDHKEQSQSAASSSSPRGSGRPASRHRTATAFYQEESSFKKGEMRDHIVIVVCGLLMENIANVIAPLRSSRIRARWRDIVILYEHNPSNEEWHSILKVLQGVERIYFVLGSPLMHLPRTSVRTAHSVIVLNNSAGDFDNEETLLDSMAVIATRSIEHRYRNLRFVMVELSHGPSIRYLGDHHNIHDTGYAQWLKKQGGEQLGGSRRRMSRADSITPFGSFSADSLGQSSRRTRSSSIAGAYAPPIPTHTRTAPAEEAHRHGPHHHVPSVEETLNDNHVIHTGVEKDPRKDTFNSLGDIANALPEYHFRPRFAAGRIFTSSMLDSLTCQSFLNPSILSLIQLMVSTASKTPAIFQVDVPEACQGRSYRFLFRRLWNRTPRMTPSWAWQSAGLLLLWRSMDCTSLSQKPTKSMKMKIKMKMKLKMKMTDCLLIWNRDRGGRAW